MSARPEVSTSGSHLIHNPGLGAPRFQTRIATLAGVSLHVVFSLITSAFQILMQPSLLYLAGLSTLFFGIFYLTPVALNHLFAILTSKISQLLSFTTPAFFVPMTYRLSQISSLTAPLFAPIVYLYCTILPGSPFCHNSTNQLAPTTTTKATRPVTPTMKSASVTPNEKIASDIFDSLAALEKSKNLACSQSEIVELALTVQCSTALDDREALADQLLELGGLTKKVKDEVINLNSLGFNTFSFFAFKVSPLRLPSAPTTFTDS